MRIVVIWCLQVSSNSRLHVYTWYDVYIYVCVYTYTNTCLIWQWLLMVSPFVRPVPLSTSSPQTCRRMALRKAAALLSGSEGTRDESRDGALRASSCFATRPVRAFRCTCRVPDCTEDTFCVHVWMCLCDLFSTCTWTSMLARRHAVFNDQCTNY